MQLDYGFCQYQFRTVSANLNLKEIWRYSSFKLFCSCWIFWVKIWIHQWIQMPRTLSDSLPLLTDSMSSYHTMRCTQISSIYRISVPTFLRTSQCWTTFPPVHPISASILFTICIIWSDLIISTLESSRLLRETWSRRWPWQYLKWASLRPILSTTLL